MTFKPENISAFMEVFNESKEKIRSFEGCNGLQLLNDANNSHIFFTYSQWQTEQHLNNYRNSLLFKSTWAKTKVLFQEKPEAWSCNKLF